MKHHRPWWLVSVTALVLPVIVRALVAPPPPITSLKDLDTFVNKIFNYMFWALILTAIAFVIVAAFKYLTSGGDPDKVKESTHQLLYAAIAVAVGLLAKSVPIIVADFFGVGKSVQDVIGP